MINVRLFGNKLEVDFTNPAYSIFNQIVAVLKSLKFTFEKESKKWYGSAYFYDNLISGLEDIDQINNTVDMHKLEEALAGEKEQSFSRIKREVDLSLMNYPPKQGKHPYENFQLEGIEKGINRSRYAYFWQMGTGKSYVAAALIAHRLYKYHDCKKVLFLTTSIGVRNLKYEICKFIKDIDESKISIGDKNNRTPFTDNADIVICSYNSFRLICDKYKEIKKIKAKSPKKPFVPFDEWAQGGELMLICDESHEIMYNTSQRGYNVALHSSCFKYRYLFSGTPADNPEKLYNQFYTLDPWLVYNMTFGMWKSKMAVLGNRFSTMAVVSWKQDELEASNKRFLQSHGNYYNTTDLIDLPNYYEKKIYLDMKPYHREIYEQLCVEDLQRSISKGETSTRDFINRFPFLMSAVDNPAMLLKHEDRFSDGLNKLIKNFKPNVLEKFDAIEDIINDHPGEKILIWDVHPLTMKMMADRFKKYNPIIIDGSVPQEERNDLLKEFEVGDHQLLIANIMTLNTSATLTFCKVQIYSARNFDSTIYDQSKARIYRISQTRDVETYILIYKDSLDVLLDINLTSKGILTKKLLDKDFLSQEEWKKVFNTKESDIDYFEKEIL